MAWRGLHLSRPSRLSLSSGQLVVAQDDGEVRLSLEDIAWVVLDTPQATLTSSLLSACMSAGVALIATDESHTPNGVVLPFHGHFRQGVIARLQLDATAPLKKRLWQGIIRRKVENQAAALDFAGRHGGTALRAMAKHIGSGDPGNVEARAARYYWGQLFDLFRRDDDADHRNKLLNFGYAVVRSGVARALVATGLLPCIGLMHASATNAFNLADDIVEPFRPFVDVCAWHLAQGDRSTVDLTLTERQTMAGVLLCDARLGGDAATLLNAADAAATSLVRAFETGVPDMLQLPALLP